MQASLKPWNRVRIFVSLLVATALLLIVFIVFQAQNSGIATPASTDQQNQITTDSAPGDTSYGGY
jgi:hypothetical protein